MCFLILGVLCFRICFIAYSYIFCIYDFTGNNNIARAQRRGLNGELLVPNFEEDPEVSTSL